MYFVIPALAIVAPIIAIRRLVIKVTSLRRV